MKMNDATNNLMTAINFLTNTFQVSGALGKKEDEDPKGGSSKEEKLSAFAPFTLEDERIWLRLLMKLRDDSDRESIRALLDKMPPRGRGFINKQMRNFAINKFRLTITGMPCSSAKKSVEVVSKLSENNKETTTTEKYDELNESQDVDERFDCLEKIAKMVGDKKTVSELKPIYQHLEMAGLIPGDMSGLAKKSKDSLEVVGNFSMKATWISLAIIIISLGISTIAIFALT